jgi:hypothetical protein
MDMPDAKNLKKRYLIWLYKVTKEELDRIERKFTQLEIDKFILVELNKFQDVKQVEKFISEFECYIKNKEKEGISLKYEGTNVSAGYVFLELKLKAVEKAAVEYLGIEGLEEIKSLYEREMTERILKSTEHR